MTHPSLTTLQRQSRILVVDADPMGRLYTEALLISHDFHVHSAVDEPEAARILDIEAIDVVLINVGTDFQARTDLPRLCDRAKRRGIAVIVVCETADEAVDADTKLSKPVADADLLDVLRRSLPTSVEASRSSTGNPSPESVLNTDTLDALAFALGSGADGVGGVIDVFAETVVAEHGRLKDCVEAGEPIAIANSAHRMAGASLQIGAHVLGSCCRRIENAVRGGGTDDIQSDLTSLDSMIVAALAELRAYRSPEDTTIV